MLKPNVNLNNKTILVTGAAGFIGCNLVLELLRSYENVHIVGIDNMNDYYDVSIKEYRLSKIEEAVSQKEDCEWDFVRGNIADKTLIDTIFSEYKPTVVVNLAAQAGVRYSITNPDVYIEANLIGFYNILEACRHNNVHKLVFASSSSVYGMNEKVPYQEDDKVETPISLYAASKKSSFFIYRPLFENY